MLYPYKFAPILVERVWGGHTLTRYGKAVPADKRIGESWEISDRNGAQSVVATGSHKGQTLRQLIETLGQQLLGSNCHNAKRFPLLVKLIDARERLSLQVHPPASIAAKLGGEPKTEMWYVLDADPGAHIIAGVRHGATGADFMRALEESPATLEQCVHRVAVMRGDAVFVPSGRMHAIDAGLVLVEIQQNSDTTYRVYDWGRVDLNGKPRQLHVRESLSSIDFGDVEPRKIVPQVEDKFGNGLWRLVDCEAFSVHRLDLRSAWLECCDGSTFHILTCVEGSLGILTAAGTEEHLAVGEFALLPAALGHYTLAPLTETARALKAFVPIPR